MKLYREGKNDLRIHLTSEDLKAFSISLEDFDYDTTKGKRVIWELFDRAKDETGFDASKEKVYIQLYPGKEGGCELFVTKIEKDEDVLDCFSFSNFDAFFGALSSFPKEIFDLSFYRENHGNTYYILLPSQRVPAIFYEFGEKTDAPSPLYLKTRCSKISHDFFLSQKTIIL